MERVDRRLPRLGIVDVREDLNLAPLSDGISRPLFRAMLSFGGFGYRYVRGVDCTLGYGDIHLRHRASRAFGKVVQNTRFQVDVCGCGCLAEFFEINADGVNSHPLGEHNPADLVVPEEKGNHLIAPVVKLRATTYQRAKNDKEQSPAWLHYELL